MTKTGHRTKTLLTIWTTSALLFAYSPLAAQQWQQGNDDGWRNFDGELINPPEEPEPVDSEPRISSMSETVEPALQVSQPAAQVGLGENRGLVRTVATRYSTHPIVRNAGIDPREFIIFFDAMIEVESAFNPNAVSSAGAIGLAQLMPGTAAYLGVDPHNRLENLDGGARYLLEQISEFGSLSLAVAAYNAGPGAVQQYNGVPRYRETERHVATVMSNYEARWRQLINRE